MVIWRNEIIINMGLDGLPDSGNKFTGSRMIVPGVGLSIYKVQKNDKLFIRKNLYAGSIPPSPTPTPSITPTNTPTPTITPTITPTPSPIPPETITFNATSLDVGSIRLGFSSIPTSATIDWGDSTTTTISTNLATTYNHTYASPYTGNIVVSYYGTVTYVGSGGSLSPANGSSLQLNTSELTTKTGLTILDMSSGGGLTGTLSNLSGLVNLTQFNIKYDLTGGDLSNLPSSIILLNDGSQGLTTMSGNLSSLSSFTGLTNLSVYGTNTITGNISNLPQSLQSVVIIGNNTISGDIVNLSQTNLLSIFVYGNNTITGDISDIPSTVTNLIIDGQNTLYGDVANIPYNVNSIEIINETSGGNLTGYLDNLPRPGYSSVLLRSNNNTLSATTAGLKVISGATLHVNVNGNLSGNLSNLPSYDFPNSMFYIDNSNGTTSISYTSGVYPWGSVSTNYIQIRTNTNLSSTELDNLIIDIDSFGGGVTWISGSNPKTLRLYGVRTASSDAAVLSLQGKGVTVTITP